MRSETESRVPVWSAIHTPFLGSGEIDEAGLRHNVRRYIDVGLAGVFCNGLIGEVWALSQDERKTILEVILDEAAGRLGVSVVVSGSSVPETLHLGAHARDVGASSVVLMVPTSGPRSDAQQRAYFEPVCRRLDMPVVIFNAATAAGSALDPAVFSHLCDIPNLRLLKTTGSKRENDALRAAARNGVVVSDPLEENFFENFQAHGQSILYADPEGYLYQTPDSRPIESYIALLAAGDIVRARALSDGLAAKRAVFNAWIMDPLRRGHMPGAALKRWCDRIGMAGGHVRMPLEPLTGDEERALTDDLDRCGVAAPA